MPGEEWGWRGGRRAAAPEEAGGRWRRGSCFCDDRPERFPGLSCVRPAPCAQLALLEFQNQMQKRKREQAKLARRRAASPAGLPRPPSATPSSGADLSPSGLSPVSGAMAGASGAEAGEEEATDAKRADVDAVVSTGSPGAAAATHSSSNGPASASSRPAPRPAVRPGFRPAVSARRTSAEAQRAAVHSRLHPLLQLAKAPPTPPTPPDGAA